MCDHTGFPRQSPMQTIARRFRMKLAKLLFVAMGVTLLGVLLVQTDLRPIVHEVAAVGLPGMALVLALYVVSFWADVASWQVTLESADMGWQWTKRLYLVRMIGEAYNNITPMASMGGEPVKAWLLKHHYGVSYRDAGASLVLAKTTSMFGLVLFVALGFGLILAQPELAPAQKWMAGFGLVGLVVWIVVFFLMQRLRLSTFAATRLGRTRFGARLTRVLAVMRDVDVLFVRFYAEHRGRLLGSTAWAVVNWLLGVVEIYLILSFMGARVSWTDAWIIESMVQLARTATFFIPAGIGTQEGMLLVTCAALTGSPSTGLSVALVRRSREIVWILCSLGLASLLAVSPRRAALDGAPPEDRL